MQTLNKLLISVFLFAGLSVQAATPSWNLLSFGARPDGSANIDTAWALAIRSVNSTAQTGELGIPGGTYKYSGALYSTNVSMRAVPGGSVFLPSLGAGPIVLITTNQDSQLYSHITEVYGLTVDGRNNPSGVGICIGTNATFNGNYTGNLTLSQTAIRNFSGTGGVALWVGNSIVNTIERFNFGSNYHAVVASAPIDITTTTFRDGVMNYSKDWAMLLTNFSGTIETTVIESSGKGAVKANLQFGYDLRFVRDWFERNWLGSSESYSNIFTIEAYPVGVDAYKRKIAFEGNHFNDDDVAILGSTNIGQIVWGENFVFAPLPYMVQARGVYSRVNVIDFPDFARANAATFFISPEAGSQSIIFTPLPYNTNQFEAISESAFPERQIRGYYGDGSWLVPLQSYVGGTTNLGLSLTDIDATGHTIGFFTRGFGTTPGKLLISDRTTGNYILTADDDQMTLPGNLTITTNLDVFLNSHLLGTLLLEGAATFNGSLNVLGTIETPIFRPTSVFTQNLTTTNGLTILEGTTAPTAAAIGAGAGRMWASNSVPPTIYWTSTTDGVTATTYKVAGP